MNNLYLLLNLGALFFPFILSFDKKVNYVKEWKLVLLASFFTAIPFLINDHHFTEIGVWGFNSDYLVGYYFSNLPVEEIAFFFIVPFCCTFIYKCLIAYFPNMSIDVFSKSLYAFILIYGVVILALGFDNSYSFSVAILAIPLSLILFKVSKKNPYLPLTFLISMVPFFLMNSVLTGAFTENPIVWYNDSENIGFRWGTVPAEDILYAFLLIVGNILMMELLVQIKLIFRHI